MSRPDDAAIRAAHRAGWEAAMNTINPSQRSPHPGMPPTRDGIRAPLPENVRTPADLAHAMHQLRGWAGAPSLRELARTTGIARATLRDTLAGTAAPKPDLLHAYIKGCGAQDDWPWWAKAWDTVRSTEWTRELTRGEK